MWAVNHARTADTAPAATVETIVPAAQAARPEASVSALLENVIVASTAQERIAQMEDAKKTLKLAAEVKLRPLAASVALQESVHAATTARMAQSAPVTLANAVIAAVLEPRETTQMLCKADAVEEKLRPLAASVALQESVHAATTARMAQDAPVTLASAVIAAVPERTKPKPNMKVEAAAEVIKQLKRGIANFKAKPPRLCPVDLENFLLCL